jgi:hypothetical protein
MKSVNRKQVGPERFGEPLHDRARESACLSLRRFPQRSRTPIEDRAQRPWRRRKKGEWRYARNDDRCFTDTSSHGGHQGREIIGEGRRRTIRNGIVDPKRYDEQIRRFGRNVR